MKRPVKVGDYVEIDNLEGNIKKISIRATTILTNDGISIIIPNQTLVNANIINWSYGNINSRIHIKVPVAYGSDPVLVTEVLLTVARQESRVLSYPAPQVWLRNFGDDSMDFELLVWIDQPKARLPIQSALNYMIENAFKKNNITIPLPQRDLWIKNPEDLRMIFKPDPTVVNSSVQTQSFPIQTIENSQGLDLSINHISLRDLLRKVVYFEQLTELEILGLIEQGYRETVVPGAFIFHEGDPGDAFHIILSGSVEILSEKLDKQIRNLQAGDFFGELSLIMGIPRTAAVRTLETTILFVVDRNVFHYFLSKYPQVADQIAEKLVERKQELLERQQLLREMGVLGAEEDLEKQSFGLGKRTNESVIWHLKVTMINYLTVLIVQICSRIPTPHLRFNTS
ncbi:MAG: mechanosensitive ion channel [Planktothrix sp. GU0601_MAG3]|nr:MAG: mechanosensitive ion channel [Planktothrix sp. GU0601_MAG3]